MATHRIFKIVDSAREEVDSYTEVPINEGPTLYGYLLSLKAETGHDHVALTDEQLASLEVVEAAALTERETAARERIRQIADPEGYAAEQLKAAAEAEYAALAEFATDEEKAKIAEALGISEP